MFLRYNELRVLVADPTAFDAKARVSERRDERERAFALRPPDWVGTATQSQLEFPYYTLWGFPEKFFREPPERRRRSSGWPRRRGSPRARRASSTSLEEFDQVKDGEILVCRMTNPAWVVLFTKIAGLVTDAGGVAAHPAVVSREFGIPAVVGTSTATQRIGTGDRVRVNGSTGVVEILSMTMPRHSHAPLATLRAPLTRIPALGLKREEASGRPPRARGEPSGVPSHHPAPTRRGVQNSFFEEVCVDQARRSLHARTSRHAHVPACPASHPGSLRELEEFAERIGAAAEGATWLTASYIVIQNDHVGTHCDAVKHLRGPDAPGVEGIPIEYCFSDGVVRTSATRLRLPDHPR